MLLSPVRAVLSGSQVQVGKDWVFGEFASLPLGHWWYLKEMPADGRVEWARKL